MGNGRTDLCNTTDFLDMCWQYLIKKTLILEEKGLVIS